MHVVTAAFSANRSLEERERKIVGKVYQRNISDESIPK